jgi:hypothetical protein
MVCKLYSDIESILLKIDFNKIWQGFSIKDFALYNKETVYLKNKTISWDQRFLGNTVIDFDGNYIAIWELESVQNNDVEYLAADMVHEMFHVHQKQNGETRFPDDLELLSYPDNLDNYKLKIIEMELLAKAFSEKNIILLKQFFEIRNIRKNLIGDIIYQEFKAETLEGMAEYAGLTSLQQINPEKYKIRLEEHISKLTSQKGLIYDTRRMAYFSGAILCSALKLLNIDFHHKFSEEKTLFEIVNKYSDAFFTEYNEHIKNKQLKFDDFLKNHSEIVKCDDYICGYDPMNMVRFEDKILCSHFVIIGSNFIKGPVLVNLKKGTMNKVKSYIK